MIEVDAAMVRSLLAEQHPDLSDLDLQLVDGGWDNQICRLGAELAVLRAVSLISIGSAWDRGLPGGQPTWGRAGRAALERVLADG